MEQNSVTLSLTDAVKINVAAAAMGCTVESLLREAGHTLMAPVVSWLCRRIMLNYWSFTGMLRLGDTKLVLPKGVAAG